MIHIAVDAMGGDHAPSAIVDGAVAAARHLDVHLSLVGAPAAIDQALDRHADWRHLGLTILDYSEYGGAPLLGVAGLAMVGHGRSSSRAVRSAIAMAYRLVTGGFIHRVERQIAAASVSPH